MPPKKGAAPEKKILLGRPGNNVKIGLVGMPNVGKSSTFNLLGKNQVAAENFPFCTIDPSDTQVVVPDKRFKHLCKEFKPKKEIPAVLTITDIAGLVKGAAEGAGLGNAFLSHIQAVDAIYHVIRAFDAKWTVDPDTGKKSKEVIEHVEGDVNPTRDMDIIRGELIAKDLEWMKNHLEQFRKKCRAKVSKEQEEEIKLMTKVIDNFEQSPPVEPRHTAWKPKEIGFLNTYPLLTSKPVVILCNISKTNYLKNQNKYFKDIIEWAKKSGGEQVIPYSAQFEEDLAQMEPEDKKKYLAESKARSAIPKIIKAGYQALSFINFFTVGADEVRAWSIRDGTLAPGAAGTIHGDFEKHFIQAEVYNYSQFQEHGSEAAVKAAGKIRSKGKDYEVVDGDIMFIKHNAGGAGKKK